MSDCAFANERVLGPLVNRYLNSPLKFVVWRFNQRDYGNQVEEHEDLSDKLLNTSVLKHD